MYEVTVVATRHINFYNCTVTAGTPAKGQAAINDLVCEK